MTGKAIKEVKDQLVQQEARMEEGHKEPADALVKVGLMDMMQELEGKPNQQYGAWVTNPRRTSQEPSSEVKVAKQKEEPGQQS